MSYWVTLIDTKELTRPEVDLIRFEIDCHSFQNSTSVQWTNIGRLQNAHVMYRIKA